LKFKIISEKKTTSNKIFGRVRNCLKYSSFRILFLNTTIAQTINTRSARGSILFFVNVPSRRNMKIRNELDNFFGSCKNLTKKYIAAVESKIVRLS